MEVENDALGLPPTAERLRLLAKRRVFGVFALERALKLSGHTPDAGRWVQFLNRLLLVLGAGFTISGIYFFFAYNWADMHRFAKLGLLEAIILGAVLLALWGGLERLSGKVALGAAGLVVGALIAVYGQIYQTGADSYQLFLLWALLIAGWVAIGRFAPLWFVWVVLLNLSLGFYWVQIIGTVDNQLYPAIFLLNGGAIVAWEVARAFGVDWLRSRWLPRLLSLPAFTALVIPTIMLIVFPWIQSTRNPDPWLLVMSVLFVIASALVFYVYSQRVLDLFMLMVAAFSIVIVFNTWVVEKLLYDLFDSALMLLCMSGLFIGQAALVVMGLRTVSKSWEARRA